MNRCKVVAEVAQAHDGSLGTAHAFIDLAAHCGADAVKFQCHIAAEESTPSEPWRIPFSKQDARRYDYWRRMEFSEPQWQGLKQHCDEKGLEFWCSPFSVKAVELLSRVGVPVWKVASGEVQSLDLWAAIRETGLPVVASTGMVNWSDIDVIVERVKSAGRDLTLLQCTTAYPSPMDQVGLNVMTEMGQRYGIPVGLSDHSASPTPGIIAAYLGATVVEVHLTMSSFAFGPDVSSSLTPEKLMALVQGVHEAEILRNHPVDKDAWAERAAPMRQLFQKSVVLREARPEGYVLTENDLMAKKPGTGTPASRLPEFVGRTLRRALEADTLIREEDVE